MCKVSLVYFPVGFKCIYIQRNTLKVFKHGEMKILALLALKRQKGHFKFYVLCLPFKSHNCYNCHNVIEKNGSRVADKGGDTFAFIVFTSSSRSVSGPPSPLHLIILRPAKTPAWLIEKYFVVQFYCSAYTYTQKDTVTVKNQYLVTFLKKKKHLSRYIITKDAYYVYLNFLYKTVRCLNHFVIKQTKLRNEEGMNSVDMCTYIIKSISLFQKVRNIFKRLLCNNAKQIKIPSGNCSFAEQNEPHLMACDICIFLRMQWPDIEFARWHTFLQWAVGTGGGEWWECRRG